MDSLLAHPDTRTAIQQRSPEPLIRLRHGPGGGDDAAAGPKPREGACVNLASLVMGEKHERVRLKGGCVITHGIPPI